MIGNKLVFKNGKADDDDDDDDITINRNNHLRDSYSGNTHTLTTHFYR